MKSLHEELERLVKEHRAKAKTYFESGSHEYRAMDDTAGSAHEDFADELQALLTTGQEEVRFEGRMSGVWSRPDAKWTVEIMMDTRPALLRVGDHVTLFKVEPGVPLIQPGDKVEGSEAAMGKTGEPDGVGGSGQ